MSDPSTSASPRQSRASWIALRTLRQIPRAVDKTADGNTIFEVRSVRLVLHAGAAHFNQILACSKCGGSALGPSVLSPSDLNRTVSYVMCHECSSVGVARTEGHREAADSIGAVENLHVAGSADAAALTTDEALERLAERAAVRSASGRADMSSRLQALEEHAKQTDCEMSELGELHAALDVGLGALRSEIVELRDALRKMVGDQAELVDRREGAAPPPPAQSISGALGEPVVKASYASATGGRPNHGPGALPVGMEIDTAVSVLRSLGYS